LWLVASLFSKAVEYSKAKHLLVFNLCDFFIVYPHSMSPENSISLTSPVKKDVTRCKDQAFIDFFLID